MSRGVHAEGWWGVKIFASLVSLSSLVYTLNKIVGGDVVLGTENRRRERILGW